MYLLQWCGVVLRLRISLSQSVLRLQNPSEVARVDEWEGGRGSVRNPEER